MRKVNDVYYIEFYARGLLYSQVAGRDPQAARQLLDSIEEKIAGGEALTIARQIDLADFFERFMDEARRQYGGPTAMRFDAVIRDFAGFLLAEFPKVCQLSQVTPAVIESYKAYIAKSHKVNRINLTLLLLRDILEFGIKLGFINDNPSLHVRLLPWRPRPAVKQTPRSGMVSQLLAKGIGLARTAQLLKISDAARLLYFSVFIPLKRPDA